MFFFEFSFEDFFEDCIFIAVMSVVNLVMVYLMFWLVCVHNSGGIRRTNQFRRKEIPSLVVACVKCHKTPWWYKPMYTPFQCDKQFKCVYCKPCLERMLHIDWHDPGNGKHAVCSECGKGLQPGFCMEGWGTLFGR